MAVSNAQVVNFLRRYAAVLRLIGADRFKVKAYQRASETIDVLDRDHAGFLQKGHDLRELPGVGAAISGMIQEIVATGKLARLDALVAALPPEQRELLVAPRLDPKLARRVYKRLKISSLAELKSRLQSGALRAAMGSRVEYQIRQGLEQQPRILLSRAERFAISFEEYLNSLPEVQHVARAGSLRRRKETVGNLSFLVGGSSFAKAIKAVKGFGGVNEISRPQRNVVVAKLSLGLTITLQFATEEQWGLELLRATGSDKHLADLTACMTKRKLRLSPASLKKAKTATTKEQQIYQGLDLQYIEPELREGRGEVERAASQTLPRLVCYEDLRGDLHMHTEASDGANSVLEMAQAAEQRGYQYIAITDHTQSLKITNGLSEERLFAQIKAIDQINRRLKALVVLKSAEVDILEDGRLDYPDAVLRELDLTICSIHSRFGLSEQQKPNVFCGRWTIATSIFLDIRPEGCS